MLKFHDYFPKTEFAKYRDSIRAIAGTTSPHKEIASKVGDALFYAAFWPGMIGDVLENVESKVKKKFGKKRNIRSRLKQGTSSILNPQTDNSTHKIVADFSKRYINFCQGLANLNADNGKKERILETEYRKRNALINAELFLLDGYLSADIDQTTYRSHQNLRSIKRSKFDQKLAKNLRKHAPALVTEIEQNASLLTKLEGEIKKMKHLDSMRSKARDALTLGPNTLFSDLLSLEYDTGAGLAHYNLSQRGVVAIPHTFIEEMESQPNGLYLATYDDVGGVIKFDGDLAKTNGLSQRRIDRPPKPSAVFAISHNTSADLTHLAYTKALIEQYAELLGTEGLIVVYNPDNQELISFKLDDVAGSQEICESRLMHGNAIVDTTSLITPSSMNKYKELFPANMATFSHSLLYVDPALRTELDARVGQLVYAPRDVIGARARYASDYLISNLDYDIAHINLGRARVNPVFAPYVANHTPILVKDSKDLNSADFDWFSVNGYSKYAIYSPSDRELVEVDTSASRRFYDVDVEF